MASQYKWVECGLTIHVSGGGALQFKVGGDGGGWDGALKQIRFYVIINVLFIQFSLVL